MKILNQFIGITTNLIIIILLLACVASYRGKLFGVSVSDYFKKNEVIAEDIILQKYHFLKQEGWKEYKSGIWQKINKSGEVVETVVFTESHAKDIYGYGGPIFLQVYLDNADCIREIKVGENYETPFFLDNILKSNFFNQFKNIVFKKFQEYSYETVSGATVSSSAMIKSISKSSEAYVGINSKSKTIDKSFKEFPLKTFIPLVVILFALILFLFFKGNKIFRTIQLIMNVIILGGCFGTMLSMQLFLNILNNGISLNASFVPLVIIIIIFVLNILNKKNFYCMWVCPFGSAQELVGKLSKKNITFSQKYQKILNNLRNFILLLLLFISWIAGLTYFFDYEPFTVFLFKQAAVPVIIIASVSLTLSVFIKRCWCRFFCPTGALLNFIQTTNK